MLLIFLLLLKHFVFDFWYQPPYQWQNKGTFGHLGGVLHSGQHAIATFAILLFFANPIAALVLSVCEFVAHYITDWSKMNLNKKMGWGANTHEEFWQLLGADQLVHQIGYILIVLCVGML